MGPLRGLMVLLLWDWWTDGLLDYIKMSVLREPLGPGLPCRPRVFMWCPVWHLGTWTTRKLLSDPASQPWAGTVSPNKPVLCDRSLLCFCVIRDTKQIRAVYCTTSSFKTFWLAFIVFLFSIWILSPWVFTVVDSFLSSSVSCFYIMLLFLYSFSFNYTFNFLHLDKDTIVFFFLEVNISLISSSSFSLYFIYLVCVYKCTCVCMSCQGTCEEVREHLQVVVSLFPFYCWCPGDQTWSSSLAAGAFIS